MERTNFESLIPTAGAYRCGGVPRGSCGVEIPFPGFCAPCVARAEQNERGGRIRAALRREIPERFAWARWGAAELAQRISGGARRCEAARKALSGGRAVIVGGAGAGKTSLACAWLRERIELGIERARFCAAHDLSSPSYLEGVSRLDLALSAGPLVLDDLGEELAAAAPGSREMAQRIEAVMKLIRARHDQGLGMVVTTGREAEDREINGRKIPGIATLYGDGIARRVFEGAQVIRLGGGT